MKNKSKILICALLAISIFALSSCFYSAEPNSNGLTKADVENMIGDIEQNVTVNGGNTYDVTINSNGNQSLLAASKSLLSAVSVVCNFEIVKTYYPIFGMQAQTQTEKATSSGSGVIYTLDKAKGDAYIITNYHVVYCNGANTEDDISDDIKVYLYGQEYKEYAINAEYVGGSVNYDIAVLRVKGDNILRESNAVAAEFADSNKTCVLDTAIAIGNPGAGGISATVGAVNVDSENITISSVDGSGLISIRVLRIDAAVNSGNSGGGLFNSEGNLIGIVNAKMSDSSIDNIGYAIPSNVAKYVADNVIYYDNLDAKNDSVYRLMLGINVGIEKAYTKYDTETGKVHKLEIVKIDNVVSGGVAEGKLLSDDIISAVTIDGVKYEIVRTFNVIDVMLTARQSSSVVFHIVRDGVNMDVGVDLSGVPLTQY